jgi:hypothetical protein
MIRNIILLLVLSFSLSAWAGQGDAPLSPPELVPASDHDPEHLTMFVTHFFRWWVDNNVRASETEENTKEHAAVLREREETLKKTLMPSLWNQYQTYIKTQELIEEDGLVFPPLAPIDNFQTPWRETAYARLDFINNAAAQLTVSFPETIILAPRPEWIFDRYSDYRDRSSLYLVALKPYQGTWRIVKVHYTY